MRLRLEFLALLAATSAPAGTDALAFVADPSSHRQLLRHREHAASLTLSAASPSPYARTKWSPRPSSASSPPSSHGDSAPGGRQLSSSSSSSSSYEDVRADLMALMDNPSWDDGSLAPIFLRLAWHSSGTYDASTGTGGSNGAGMRFSGGMESRDPENAGLQAARAFLEPIKARYPHISYSDLWILASYVGLEHTGGPIIPFTPGRVDHVDESYWSRNGMSYGRLPAAEKYCCPHLDDSNVSSSIDPTTGTVRGWEGLCTHVRDEVFYRMGFNDREIVALLCGGHVYGRCHPNASGYAGPWVEHPTKFSNEYASDMIEDEWTLVSNGDGWLIGMGAEELIPAPGKRQFVNKVPGKVTEDGGDGANQMMLLSDMILKWDPTFRQYLELYAEDEELLRNDFGVAFKKLTELGCGF
ncbi:hypothetical protein ACHAXA_002095 [Cyclostephanos tholiformis]|uniref:Plant heme peroxidase family profile domain-containing protein n=1 Tax=Cyclostephanos tholiformis TaxID=382380 RepID=A0ABD3STM7_9STRA